MSMSRGPGLEVFWCIVPAQLLSFIFFAIVVVVQMCSMSCCRVKVVSSNLLTNSDIQRRTSFLRIIGSDLLVVKSRYSFLLAHQVPCHLCCTHVND